MKKKHALQTEYKREDTSEQVTPEVGWVAPEAADVADVGGLTNFKRFTAALLTW